LHFSAAAGTLCGLLFLDTVCYTGRPILPALLACWKNNFIPAKTWKQTPRPHLLNDKSPEGIKFSGCCFGVLCFNWREVYQVCKDIFDSPSQSPAIDHNRDHGVQAYRPAKGLGGHRHLSRILPLRDRRLVTEFILKGYELTVS
jgi:hypothetical protein